MRLLLAVAAVVLLAGDVAAQAPTLDSLASGAWLRIRTNRLGQTAGRLRDRQGDTLTLLRRPGDTLFVPRRELLHAEVSVGRRRPIVKRTAVGLVAGAAVGAAITYAGFGEGSLFLNNGGEAAALGAFVGGTFGSAVGFLVGMNRPVDVWQQVWPPSAQ